eukprot:GHVU01069945.1.p1 GENE.GHVU01069945.1~~GHVU01069945.1.p1  ORF type:complete len:115 (-),score=21.45 GHVU01069945.1:264-608(-)
MMTVSPLGCHSPTAAPNAGAKKLSSSSSSSSSCSIGLPPNADVAAAKDKGGTRRKRKGKMTGSRRRRWREGSQADRKQIAAATAAFVAWTTTTRVPCDAVLGAAGNTPPTTFVA